MENPVITEEVRMQIINSLKIEPSIETVIMDLRKALNNDDSEKYEKIEQLFDKGLSLCKLRRFRNKAFSKQELQTAIELTEIKPIKVETKKQRKSRR
jgi:hypothetical protein